MATLVKVLSRTTGTDVDVDGLKIILISSAPVFSCLFLPA